MPMVTELPLSDQAQVDGSHLLGKICRLLPTSSWLTHPGCSGVAQRQYVQAGEKGPGGLQEPRQRVTKPWHI